MAFEVVEEHPGVVLKSGTACSREMWVGTWIDRTGSEAAVYRWSHVGRGRLFVTEDNCFFQLKVTSFPVGIRKYSNCLKMTIQSLLRIHGQRIGYHSSRSINTTGMIALGGESCTDGSYGDGKTFKSSIIAD